jgi:hypothetical protein
MFAFFSPPLYPFNLMFRSFLPRLMGVVDDEMKFCVVGSAGTVLRTNARGSLALRTWGGGASVFS